MNAASERNSPPLAVTMGEPAGVGADLTLAAWKNRDAESLPAFFALDDPNHLAQRAAILGLDVPIKTIDQPSEAPTCFADALPVLPVRLAASVEVGTLDVRNAPAVLDSIRQAVAHCQSGEAGAVVTNPIHKSVLLDAGFKHPGHTEFLAELAGPGHQSVMMLSCPELRVVPITVHVSLRDAVDQLSTELIVARARITAEALTHNFGITNPRLAFSGLNPHAGEDGKMGREEIDIIAPAVDQLTAEGIHCIGPLSADTMFHAEARATYDAALCMYHDQALIPIKTLDFYGGVNITLGLPFIRTSPDHGTALGIAGTGQANSESFLSAIRYAGQMRAQRQDNTGQDDV